MQTGLTIISTIVVTLLVLTLILFLVLGRYIRLWPLIKQVLSSGKADFSLYNADVPSEPFVLVGADDSCHRSNPDTWRVILVTRHIYDSPDPTLPDSEGLFLKRMGAIFNIDHQALLFVNEDRQQWMQVTLWGQMIKVFVPTIKDNKITIPEANTQSLKRPSKFGEKNNPRDLRQLLEGPPWPSVNDKGQPITNPGWNMGQIIGTFESSLFDEVMDQVGRIFATPGAKPGTTLNNPYALFQAVHSLKDTKVAGYELTCATYVQEVIACLQPFLEKNKSFTAPYTIFQRSLSALQVVSDDIVQIDDLGDAGAVAWARKQNAAFSGPVNLENAIRLASALLDDLTKEMYIFMYLKERRDRGADYKLFRVRNLIIRGKPTNLGLKNCLVKDSVSAAPLRCLTSEL